MHDHHEYHREADPGFHGHEHHAVYTPATVIAQAGLSSSGGTSLLTGVNLTVYVIRTWNVQANSSSKTFTVSFGADAAGKRLWDAYALTANVPLIANGWWTVTGSGAAHDIDGNCSATTVSLGAFGYTYA